MAKFIINGGKVLKGEIDVQKSKNAVLPILAASILTEQKIKLNDCPDILDVDNMLKILVTLGCNVERFGKYVIIDSSPISSDEIPSKLAKELRSSIFLLGPILARLKKAKVAYPGGCDIGIRPIDIHIKGLKALNVNVKEEHGYIICDASNMKGADMLLDFPSVGATENIMMAATGAKGKTIIRNAAKEPEISDLQNFLVSCGVNVSGAGTGTIIVEGCGSIHGTEYTPIPDRIAAGTYILAALMTRGNLTINNVVPEHITSLISKLTESSCKVQVFNDKITINNSKRIKAFEIIETMPYPGFPTDLQAPMSALCCVADGTSIILENMFETRFKHVSELVKMGAKIIVRDKAAYITGVRRLHGADVKAYDLRGGAALILAGLSADGTTAIDDIYHIERGYQRIENVISSLGGEIFRVR